MITNSSLGTKQIEIDRDLLAVNSLYCKQLLLDTLNGYENVTFDFDQVTDCDTAGVQLLLSLKKTASTLSRQVRFRNVPDVVLDAMEKYGLKLSDMFQID